jgi:hypothetical protein
MRGLCHELGKLCFVVGVPGCVVDVWVVDWLQF